MALPSIPFPQLPIKSTGASTRRNPGSSVFPSPGSFNPGSPSQSSGTSLLRSLLDEQRKRAEENAWAEANGLTLGANDPRNYPNAGVSNLDTNLRRIEDLKNAGMATLATLNQNPWWAAKAGAGGLLGTLGLDQNIIYGLRKNFYEDSPEGKWIEGWSEGKLGKTLPKWLTEGGEEIAGAITGAAEYLTPFQMVRLSLDPELKQKAWEDVKENVAAGYKLEDMEDFSDILDELGWEYDDSSGYSPAKFLRGATSLIGNVVTSPSTYAGSGIIGGARQGLRRVSGELLEGAAKQGRYIDELGKLLTSSRSSMDDVMKEGFEQVVKNAELVPAVKSEFARTALRRGMTADTFASYLGRFLDEDVAIKYADDIMGAVDNFRGIRAELKATQAERWTVRQALEMANLPTRITEDMPQWIRREVQKLIESGVLDENIDDIIKGASNRAKGIARADTLSGAKAEAIATFVRRTSPGYGLIGLEIPFTNIRSAGYGGGVRAAISDTLHTLGRSTSGQGVLWHAIPRFMSRTRQNDFKMGSRLGAYLVGATGIMEDVGTRNIAQYVSSVDVDRLGAEIIDGISVIEGMPRSATGRRELIDRWSTLIGIAEEYSKRPTESAVDMRIVTEMLYRNGDDAITEVVVDRGTKRFVATLLDGTTISADTRELAEMAVREDIDRAAKEAAQNIADDAARGATEVASDTAEAAAKTTTRSGRRAARSASAAKEAAETVTEPEIDIGDVSVVPDSELSPSELNSIRDIRAKIGIELEDGTVAKPATKISAARNIRIKTKEGVISDVTPMVIRTSENGSRYVQYTDDIAALDDSARASSRSTRGESPAGNILMKNAERGKRGGIKVDALTARQPEIFSGVDEGGNPVVVEYLSGVTKGNRRAILGVTTTFPDGSIRVKYHHFSPQSWSKYRSRLASYGINISRDEAMNILGSLKSKFGNVRTAMGNRRAWQTIFGGSKEYSELADVIDEIISRSGDDGFEEKLIAAFEKIPKEMRPSEILAIGDVLGMHEFAEAIDVATPTGRAVLKDMLGDGFDIAARTVDRKTFEGLTYTGADGIAREITGIKLDDIVIVRTREGSRQLLDSMDRTVGFDSVWVIRRKPGGGDTRYFASKIEPILITGIGGTGKIQGRSILGASIDLTTDNHTLAAYELADIIAGNIVSDKTASDGVRELISGATGRKRLIGTMFDTLDYDVETGVFRGRGSRGTKTRFGVKIIPSSETGQTVVQVVDTASLGGNPVIREIRAETIEEISAAKHEALDIMTSLNMRWVNHLDRKTAEEFTFSPSVDQVARWQQQEAMQVHHSAMRYTVDDGVFTSNFGETGALHSKPFATVGEGADENAIANNFFMLDYDGNARPILGEVGQGGLVTVDTVYAHNPVIAELFGEQSIRVANAEGALLGRDELMDAIITSRGTQSPVAPISELKEDVQTDLFSDLLSTGRSGIDEGEFLDAGASIRSMENIGSAIDDTGMTAGRKAYLSNARKLKEVQLSKILRGPTSNIDNEVDDYIKAVTIVDSPSIPRSAESLKEKLISAQRFATAQAEAATKRAAQQQTPRLRTGYEALARGWERRVSLISGAIDDFDTSAKGIRFGEDEIDVETFITRMQRNSEAYSKSGNIRLNPVASEATSEIPVYISPNGDFVLRWEGTREGFRVLLPYNRINPGRLSGETANAIRFSGGGESVGGVSMYTTDIFLQPEDIVGFKLQDNVIRRPGSEYASSALSELIENSDSALSSGGIEGGLSTTAGTRKIYELIADGVAPSQLEKTAISRSGILSAVQAEKLVDDTGAAIRQSWEDSPSAARYFDTEQRANFIKRYTDNLLDDVTQRGSENNPLYPPRTVRSESTIEPRARVADSRAMSRFNRDAKSLGVVIEYGEDGIPTDDSIRAVVIGRVEKLTPELQTYLQDRIAGLREEIDKLMTAGVRDSDSARKLANAEKALATTTEAFDKLMKQISESSDEARIEREIDFERSILRGDILSDTPPVEPVSGSSGGSVAQYMPTRPGGTEFTRGETVFGGIPERTRPEIGVIERGRGSGRTGGTPNTGTVDNELDARIKEAFSRIREEYEGVVTDSRKRVVPSIASGDEIGTRYSFRQNKNGTIRVTARTKDASTPIGTFEDERAVAEWLDTFGLIRKRSSEEAIDYEILNEAIEKFKAAGLLSRNADTSALGAVWKHIIETEQAIYNDMIERERGRRLQFETSPRARVEYAPGYVPVRNGLSRTERNAFEALNVGQKSPVDIDSLDSEMRRIFDELKGTGARKFKSPQEATFDKIARLTGSVDEYDTRISGASGGSNPQKAIERPLTLLDRARTAKDRAPLPFETNIMKRMESRSAAGEIAATRAELMSALGSLIGTPTFRRGDKAGRVAVQGRGSYDFSNNALSAFNDIFQRDIPRMTTAQKLTAGWFVPLMTSFRPAFVINNTIGNIDLALRNGMLDYNTLAAQIKINRFVFTNKGGDDIVRVAGGEYTVRSLAEDQIRRGIVTFPGLDPRLMETGLEKASGIYGATGALKPLGEWTGYWRRVNTGSENLFRGAAYLKGVYKHGYNPTVAQGIVNDILFDYSRYGLTDQEMVFRQLVPFYNWTRRNTPASIEFIKRKPALAAALYIEGPTSMSEINGEQSNISEQADFWKSSITEAQRQGIPITVGGMLIPNKLPMNDFFEMVQTGYGVAQGLAGNNPFAGQQTLDYLQQFIGPFPKLASQAVTGTDEFGNSILENPGGIAGTKIGANGGILTAILDAAASSIPGIGNFYNAVSSENTYENTNGARGNQYAMDNMLPGILGKVPVLKDLLKLSGERPITSTGSFLMTQSPQTIDNEKVQRDWINQTGREYDTLRQKYERETGNAMYSGVESLDTAIAIAKDTISRIGPQSQEQVIAIQMIQQLESDEDMFNSISNRISEQQKQEFRLEMYRKRWEILKLLYGVDENGAVNLPPFPVNAGLSNNMTIGIPAQYENAMLGVGYDQSGLNERVRRWRSDILNNPANNVGR